MDDQYKVQVLHNSVLSKYLFYLDIYKTRAILIFPKNKKNIKPKFLKMIKLFNDF